MIDSRDFLAAKRRADNEVIVPSGPKIACSGGDTTDHRLIWAKLDRAHAKAAPFKRNEAMLAVSLIESSSSPAPVFRRTLSTRLGSSASRSASG
ncbi:hypothetical protein GCM10011499_10910 [Pelagibacterium lentulum]|uniref:Uncharacterized protein n=1 Tax=Pelagibacterium lentulum TaxID=2029865 RepID=A0A916R847_9HYPH|nr:hypothetical protein GCM10011499_10910 [Pelagibacterium lentulum]